MNYNTIVELFAGICSAIREKDGTTEPISHQDIPDRILAIGDKPKDEYGTILYKLPGEKILNGTTDVVNTHVQLYDDVHKNWTVVCSFDNHLSREGGYPYSVITCQYDTLKGLTVRRSADGEELTLLVGSSGIRTDLAGIPERDGKNVLIIVKTDGNYRIYLNGSIAYGGGLDYPLQESDATDAVLIAGARMSLTGEIECYTAFTLHDMRVYENTLTDAQVEDLTTKLLA